MMKYILDANTLIYLTKLNLYDQFIQFLDKEEIFIDTSVYEESVEEGIKNNYPDANLIKDWLQKKKIPIIPIDISKEISIYRDPGETSCALLTKEDTENSICITSDKKAINKLYNNNIPHTQLDVFYYKLYLEKIINESEFFDKLYKLESVFAIAPERIMYFHELIYKKKELA